jgi:hypothetical protein
MTKKPAGMERVQLVEDQRRVLLNVCAVLTCAAHGATDDIVDRDQLSDVMLVASRMVDDVASKLEELMKI